MIGGLVRVSSKQQADGQSPENQQETLAAAGATRFYIDTVSGSAKGGQKRRQSQGWQDLMRDIKSGALSKLLVCDVSRIARRDSLITELVEACDAAGIDFLAHSGGQLTAKTASGWLSVKQQGIFAEYFARELSDKIRRGQAACISQGKFGFTDAHLPWHLQRDPADKHKVIARVDRWDDAKAAVTGYIEGRLTMAQLCRDISSKHGVLKFSGAAHKWLKSAWLLGHYASRDTGEILIANIAPPLIDEEQHRLLSLRMQQNRKLPGTRAPHRKHALTGLCICVKCGKQMTYSSRTTKGTTYKYMRCGQPGCESFLLNVREQLLEELIREHLDQVDLAQMELAAERQRSAVKPSKELLNLRLSAKKLQEALAIIDNTAVADELRKTQQRIAELEAAHQPSEPRITLRQIREAGSENWWAQRNDQQRNTDYLSVIEQIAVVVEKGWATVQYVLLRGED